MHFPLFPTDSAPRVLAVAARVDAPRPEVWRAWTEPARAREFLAPDVEVEPRPGGRFAVYFDPGDPTKSTRGSVLSLAPPTMLSFDWRLPPPFSRLIAEPMWVVVGLAAEGPARTMVSIQHLGWGDGPAWDDAFHHMERGWRDLLGRLQHRFAHGPIDWRSEMAAAEEPGEFTLRARPTAG